MPSLLVKPLHPSNLDGPTTSVSPLIALRSNRPAGADVSSLQDPSFRTRKREDVGLFFFVALSSALMIKFAPLYSAMMLELRSQVEIGPLLKRVV